MIHSRARISSIVLTLCLLAAPGCTTHGPTTADPSASTPRPNESVALVAPSTPSIASAAPSGSAPSPASSLAPPPEPDPLESPKLVDESGNPLPQTEDKPSFESAAFQKRMRLLFEAIQKDDPEIAAPSFFPKIAYVQVKDIPHADGDWKSRLMRAFARDIHEYHKAMKKPEDAQFIGYKADPKYAKWMAPRAEGNKVGYYRITHTKLQYKNADGKDREMDVTSLISWRGEFFVVHLHGFK
jgi:hypothetical protein